MYWLLSFSLWYSLNIRGVTLGSSGGSSGRPVRLGRSGTALRAAEVLAQRQATSDAGRLTGQSALGRVSELGRHEMPNRATKPCRCSKV